MRRTSARQVELPDPFAFAKARCHVCGGPLGTGPLTVVCLGSNDNGALDIGFCSAVCAGARGWPRCYPSEQPKAKPTRRTTASRPQSSAGGQGTALAAATTHKAAEGLPAASAGLSGP